ncbi:CRTAC1 family protein [Caulobacter sp. X]|uniref:CRTAC1 family protein n=1 Tax=Caulobacter sp. X TaxID=2048901 RepID=UPI0013747232|nr:CRTAC1 family protein [Caulobacter sp. X]
MSAACLAATGAEAGEAKAQTAPRFKDVTGEVGLSSPSSWKYGGPLVADLDQDGNLDLVLGNHDRQPTMLFWGTTDGKFVKGEFPAIYPDVHGLAAADFDNDGDLDLLVAVGGGNGKSPRPPVLLRQEGRRFTDVTAEAGLKGVGARGRSVRWVDVDGDGDLDILSINAIQLPGETGPRSFFFENLGDGRFAYHKTSDAFEINDAERALQTDIDGDGRPDFITFSPLSVWKNLGNFQFRDVSAEVLPAGLQHAPFVTAASEADIDGDGDFDIYLARGKVYYEIANNAVSFSPITGRLDLRDEGNKSQDWIEFTAPGDVVLRDFWHFPRAPNTVLPVYLGAGMVRVDTPVEPLSVAPRQAEGLPTALDKDGWFLSYLGEGRWRLAWNLSGDLAWDLRASVTGLSAIQPRWTPNVLGVRDILLRNDGGKFTDISTQLPAGASDNNWGVASGDFDNDGRIDFFVNRFGELRQRIPDLLFRNLGGGRFENVPVPSATTDTGDSHGDMSAAFDQNGDGWLDVLTGDDDNGHWRLYRNLGSGPSARNWSEIKVLRSPVSGIDAQGALVVLKTPLGQQRRRVASSGEVHTQSILNPVHFGLGAATKIERVTVTWRDGSTQVLRAVRPGSILTVGVAARPDHLAGNDFRSKSRP